MNNSGGVYIYENNKEKKFGKNFQQAGTFNSSIKCVYLFTLTLMENI